MQYTVTTTFTTTTQARKVETFSKWSEVLSYMRDLRLRTAQAYAGVEFLLTFYVQRESFAHDENCWMPEGSAVVGYGYSNEHGYFMDEPAVFSY